MWRWRTKLAFIRFADPIAQPNLAPQIGGFEFGGGRHLQRDTSELLADFGKRYDAFANGGIENGDRTVGNRASARILRRSRLDRYVCQHDEVIQFPVQHARQLQLIHLLQFKPQRATRKPERLRMAHQLIEVCAFERDREALTKLGKINAQAMRAGEHREAG